MVVEVLHIHCAGGTLPTMGGRFLMVTIFSLLRAGRLSVLTIWGGVTESLAPYSWLPCCSLSEREGGETTEEDLSHRIRELQMEEKEEPDKVAIFV